MAYLDAAQDRIGDRAEAQFEAMVEAVRTGYITARDAKQHSKWQRRARRGKRQVGLTGEALERAVMALAQRNPEYVVMGA